MSGGRSGYALARELWLRLTDASVKPFKIVPSAEPAGSETKWVLPTAIPTTGQILDATVAGTTVTLNWVAKPSGGGTPTVTSLSSAVNSQQIFKGASGTAFTTIEFYDLLAVNTLTAPQATALGANALVWQTGTDTVDLLVNARLQAISSAPNPSQNQIPQLSTAGTLSFVNRDTFAASTGTTSTTFLLDSGGTPVMLKDVSGGLALRNSADNADANLTVKDLTVSGNVTLSGTGTLVTGNTVELGDNILRLNADLPGASAPTENAGLEIQRGTAGVTTLLLWDESTDEVFITQGGSLKKVSIDEEFTFTSTSNTATVVFTAGILTLNHNKNRQRFRYQIVDPSNKAVSVEATYVSANQATFDLTGFLPLAAGNWTVIC